jgi:hypothetical protein
LGFVCFVLCSPVGLKLVILLPQSSKCWDYSYVLPLLLTFKNIVYINIVFNPLHAQIKTCVSEFTYFILFVPSDSKLFITLQIWRKRRAQIIQKSPLDQKLQCFTKAYNYNVHFRLKKKIRNSFPDSTLAENSILSSYHIRNATVRLLLIQNGPPTHLCQSHFNKC